MDITDKGKVSLSIKKALPEQPRPKPQKPRQNKSAPKTWKGTEEQSGPMSFEDMMAKFKAQSEDKMSDLKRNTDKRTGYRRK